MNPWLSPEQAEIREAVSKFTANECPRELVRALDAQEAFPIELVKRLDSLGLFGLNVPEAFGGAGPDLLATALVISELARVAPVLAIAFSASALRGSRVIAEWGNPAQQQALLPLLASGEARVTCAGEPEDARAVCANVDGGEYRLNGLARFVAMADQSDLILTLARTPSGFTTFVVPASIPGLRVVPIKKIGTRGATLCRVQYEQVVVTGEQILGGAEQAGQGMRIWQGIRALEGIEMAALGLGIAQGALDYASAYARERVQFGKSIVTFEAIQHMLVDMTVQVHSLELTLCEACALADRGADWQVNAAICRLLGATVARQAALQSLHILGGYGYMAEYDAQRYVRDALALIDGSESVEVIKNELGGMLGFDSQ